MAFKADTMSSATSFKAPFKVDSLIEDQAPGLSLQLAHVKTENNAAIFTMISNEKESGHKIGNE
jgi:hypothetical protein